MSYSNSFPQQRPTLNLDFANSGKLDSRLSYSRSSGGTYMSNEKSLNSENLLPYSNDLSQSVWTKRNLTVPANNIAAPDGTSSASSLLETAATGTHDFYEEFTAVSGKSYTFTMYAKANGRDTLHVSPQATSTIASVVYDLTAATSTVISGSADSHSIAAIGSTGWFKLQVTVTATASGTGFLQTYFKVGGSTSYAGDATKGAYIWGCQVSSIGETVLNETSGQIHREFAPTLKTAAADAARFEYAADGQSVGSGTAKGLLIEAQATNLLTYSEDWANSDFTKFVAITSNAGIAPTGELAADLVTATSSAGDHITRQSLTVVSGQTYSMSVFAKASGCNFVRIGGASTAAMPAQASFDLVNGTVGTVDYGTAKIEDVGNGFYRCSVTGTAASNTSTHLEIRLMQSDNTPSWTGDDYSGLLLFGQMAEQSSSVSSYIKTTSSSVSRAADSCSVALSETNYSGGEGSLVVDLSINGRTSGIGAVISDGSTENYYQVGQFATSLTYILYSELNNSVQANITQSETSVGSKKLAASWDTNDISACLDGGTVTTDTSNAFPLLTDLDIGSNPTGAAVLNGHVKRLSLFNVALSDTELKTLTTS